MFSCTHQTNDFVNYVIIILVRMNDRNDKSRKNSINFVLNKIFQHSESMNIAFQIKTKKLRSKVILVHDCPYKNAKKTKFSPDLKYISMVWLSRVLTVIVDNFLLIRQKFEC